MDDKLKSKDRIYDFIVDYIDQNGFSPTVREICTGVGLKSTSNVHSYLNDLEDEGRIKRSSALPRTIQVIDRQKKQPEGRD